MRRARVSRISRICWTGRRGGKKTRWIEKSLRAKLEPRNTTGPSKENVFIPLYTNMSPPAHQNFMYIQQNVLLHYCYCYFSYLPG